MSVGSVNENGTAKTYQQMYQEAAGAINAQSGAGVRASVSNVDGRISLVLSSAREGEAGGFTVSGNAGAASGIEDASVRAQDAVYTVTGNGITQTLRSDTNKISLDYGRIGAELKGTGEARVYTGIDEDTVVSAVEDLVKRYNEVSGLLKDNGDRGTGAVSHLASFGRGMADAKTLKAVGITYNKDGELELDKDTLKNALETDLEGTKSLWAGSLEWRKRRPGGRSQPCPTRSRGLWTATLPLLPAEGSRKHHLPTSGIYPILPEAGRIT